MRRAILPNLGLHSVEQGASVVVEDETAHYFNKVLRLKAGEFVELLDGQGLGVRGKWLRDEKRVVEVEPFVLEKKLPNLVIAQAMVKAAKLEEVVRRGTELGASRIVLFEAARSQGRFGLKEKERIRLLKVAADAARQSLRGTLPEITGLLSFAEFRKTLKVFAGVKAAGWVQAEQTLSAFLHLQKEKLQIEGLQILVGPEGGFTDDENCLFLADGVTPIRLGAYVMRTETAGPVALACAQSVLGML